MFRKINAKNQTILSLFFVSLYSGCNVKHYHQKLIVRQATGMIFRAKEGIDKKAPHNEKKYPTPCTLLFPVSAVRQ
jgi:hypothetical protein